MVFIGKSLLSEPFTSETARLATVIRNNIILIHVVLLVTISKQPSNFSTDEQSSDNMLLIDSATLAPNISISTCTDQLSPVDTILTTGGNVNRHYL